MRWFVLIVTLLAALAPSLGRPAPAAAQSAGGEIALTEQWTAEFEGSALPGAVVVDGVLYTGSDEDIIYAIDIETGKVLWQTPSAFFSAPVVSHGLLFTHSFDEETQEGRMAAVTIASEGTEEVWSFGTVEGFTTGRPIITDEGVMIVNLSRGEVPEKGDPFTVTVALDIDDGTELWRLDTTVPFSYANGVLYMLTLDGRAAMDPVTAEVHWVLDVKFTDLHEGIFYGYEPPEEAFHAVDAATGEHLWDASFAPESEDMGSLGLRDGLWFFDESDDEEGTSLLAYDLATQEVRWSIDKLPGESPKSIVDGDLLYVGLGRDSADLPGAMMVLDVATGETLFEMEELDVRNMILVDGVLYAGVGGEVQGRIKAFAIGEGETAGGAGDETDELTETLDIAAIPLTPDDVDEAGFEGYGLGFAEFQTADAVIASVATTRGIDEDEAREIMEDAGLIRRYDSYLYLPADQDDPGGVASSLIGSYVLEFADEEGAADAFAVLEDEPRSSGSTDVELSQELGDAAEATRSSGEDPETGDPYEQLDVTVQIGPLHVGVAIVDWTGEEPDLADAEALAARIVERVESVRAGDAPGLGEQALRLSGETVQTSADYYLQQDGEANRLYGETARDARQRENRYDDLTQTDAYRLWLLLAPGDDDTGDEIWHLAEVRRYDDEDAAQADLEGTEDRFENDDAFQGYTEDDAPTYGDDSLTYTFETADGATHYRSAAIRVGATLVVIELLGPEEPSTDTLDLIAEAQVACLESGGCAEPLPMDGALADFAGGGSSGDAEGESTTDNAPEETGDATEAGVYEATMFDFSLTYDPTVWELTAEEDPADDEFEWIVLVSEASTVRFAGMPELPQDELASCPETWLVEMGWRDAWQVEPFGPLVEEDGRVYASYLLEDPIFGLTGYLSLECRSMDDGTLLIAHFAGSDGADEGVPAAAIEQFLTLLDGLETGRDSGADSAIDSLRD